MAAKNKTKKKPIKRARPPSPAKKPKTAGKPKVRYEKVKLKPGAKKLKCCHHCQDYEFCNDRGTCCEYCDFLVKGKCTHGRKRELLSADKENIEIGDYRGDDYGIDDYEAYEDLYE